MKSGIRARLKKNRIIAICIAIVAIGFCILMLAQILNLRKKSADLEARNTRLEEQLNEQKKRQEELDGEEDYVNTQDYIEEKAKSYGYVYPDEIIFKRED